jgi:hypothetical protein
MMMRLPRLIQVGTKLLLLMLMLWSLTRQLLVVARNVSHVSLGERIIAAIAVSSQRRTLAETAPAAMGSRGGRRRVRRLGPRRRRC